MKIQAAVLLLFLVSVSGFLRRPGNSLASYKQFQKFVRVHVVDTAVGVDDCTMVIERLKINEEKKCKKINTFIQANEQDVTDVCNNGEKDKVRDEIMYKSKGKFKVTVCKSTNKIPKCEYEGEIKEAKIVIKCINMSLPVHFHGVADYDYEELLWY